MDGSVSERDKLRVQGSKEQQEVSLYFLEGDGNNEI